MSKEQQAGWRHNATEGVEDIWALAQVEWLAEEEPPDVWEMATFDHPGADGCCFMGIDLDHPVQRGDTTISPITFYAAQHPIEQLLREGAVFRMERSAPPGEPDEPVAQGRVIGVQRSPECLPGSLLHTTLLACQTPSEAVMRQALEARSRLSPAAGDYLSYLAGFTHYREAEACLSEFGLCFEGRPPRLVDPVRQCVHFKILLQDYCVPGLDRLALAQRYACPIFINRVHAREPDGTWVVEWPRFASYRDYLQWEARVQHRLLERVHTFRGPENAPDGSRVVFHTDRLPQMNVGANCERMCRNASAVIATAWDDRENSLSFRMLENVPQVWEELSRAFWLLVETEHLPIGTRFLESIGAEYTVVPDDDSRDDYLEQVMSILLERL